MPSLLRILLLLKKRRYPKIKKRRYPIFKKEKLTIFKKKMSLWLILSLKWSTLKLPVRMVSIKNDYQSNQLLLLLKAIEFSANNFISL